MDMDLKYLERTFELQERQIKQRKRLAATMKERNQRRFKRGECQRLSAEKQRIRKQKENRRVKVVDSIKNVQKERPEKIGKWYRNNAKWRLRQLKYLR